MHKFPSRLLFHDTNIKMVSLVGYYLQRQIDAVSNREIHKSL